MALGARREDLQDQHRAVGHGHAQVALQVSLLGRRERLVEQHRFRAVPLDQRLDLVGLARADEQRRIWGFAARDHAGHRLVAGGLGQEREFVERFVEGPATAEIDADEDGPRRLAAGADGVRRTQACSEGSLGWKFTARPGTTVEIACL